VICMAVMAPFATVIVSGPDGDRPVAPNAGFEVTTAGRAAAAARDVAAAIVAVAWGAAATASRPADGEPLLVPVCAAVVDRTGAMQPQRTTAATTAAADKAIRRIADGIIGLPPGFQAEGEHRAGGHGGFRVSNESVG